MNKESTLFLVFALVVMILFGVGVRIYLFAPQAPVGGPVLRSHPADRSYEGKCSICHEGVEQWHKAAFTEFNNETCMNCHGGATGTPHAIDGQFEHCMSCHAEITPGHNEMFESPGRSYEDCLICHIPS